MRRRLGLFLAIGLLSGLIGQSALAQTAPQPPNLDLSVMDVRVFGNWTHQQKKGYFRSIIARQSASAGLLRFYLQWMVVADDTSVSLLKTLSPAELIKEGVSVIDFRHEMDRDGLALFIDTIHPQTKADVTFEMFVINPEEYDINPASN